VDYFWKYSNLSRHIAVESFDDRMPPTSTCGMSSPRAATSVAISNGILSRVDNEGKKMSSRNTNAIDEYIEHLILTIIYGVPHESHENNLWNAVARDKQRDDTM